MIKVEHIEVFNFEGAIRGLRNPMNSWDKSDSINCRCGIDCDYCKWDYPRCNQFYIGQNDLDLMQRLYKAGHPHRKYLRQIMVSMDITAPLYFWKQADQYKVGTTTNSCSTMHKIHDKEFELDDFSYEHLTLYSQDCLSRVIRVLNEYREEYLKNKDKKMWWQMIQLLPSSYNQKRTITMNYENVFNMLLYRENHKLDEWNELCKIFKDLPYVREIMDENRYMERRAMR